MRLSFLSIVALAATGCAVVPERSDPAATSTKQDGQELSAEDVRQTLPVEVLDAVKQEDFQARAGCGAVAVAMDTFIHALAEKGYRGAEQSGCYWDDFRGGWRNVLSLPETPKQMWSSIHRDVANFSNVGNMAMAEAGILREKLTGIRPYTKKEQPDANTSCYATTEYQTVFCLSSPSHHP